MIHTLAFCCAENEKQAYFNLIWNGVPPVISIPRCFNLRMRTAFGGACLLPLSRLPDNGKYSPDTTGIIVQTVKFHFTNIFGEIDAKKRQQAVKVAKEHRIL